MQIKIDLKLFLLALLFLAMGQIEIYAFLILFAFLHELGHLGMGLCVGLKPREVNITPFGVAITFKNEVRYYTPNQKMFKEMAVAMAGPLVNIAVCILCIVLPIQNKHILIVNIVLALFNLLPIFPLDGGRMIKSALLRVTSCANAENYIYTISNAMMILLTMLCSVVILYYHNIALLVAIAYLWWIVIRENRKLEMWRKYKEEIVYSEKIIPEYRGSKKKSTYEK